MNKLKQAINSELNVDTLAPRVFYEMLVAMENKNLGYREKELIKEWFILYSQLQYDEAGKFVAWLGQK